MKEKKSYNIKVLSITTIIFLIPLVIGFFEKVKINFIMESSQSIRDIIGIGIYLVLILPILIIVAKNSFKKFIKRERDTDTKKGFYSLFILSVISSLLLYLLNTQIFVYMIAILFSIAFYSVFLLFLDRNYEKQSLNNKMSINDAKVAQFMNALGGKENVVDVSYELRRVKIELNDVEQVNPDEIKELGATGMFISGNKLQAIIGENAEELDESLKKYLSK